MKKKQRLTIWDLGRRETTPPVVQREAGVGHLWEYRRTLEREEQEKAARMQSAIEQTQAESSRIMAECLSTSAPLKANFWSQPIDKLKTRLRDEDAFDELFLEKSDEDVDSNEIYDRVMAFCNDIPTLEAEDERRFNLYVACQVLNNVVINDLSLRMMFDRCLSLGLFKGIVEPTIPTPTRPPVQQEEPRRESLGDFESIDTTTRDGSRRAKNLAENLYVEEMLPIATQWVESIQKHYGFSPTSEDLRRVSNWIERNNLNRLAHSTYDSARKWLVASGYWPETCLMETEKFRLELEKLDTSRLTVQERNALNRKELAARESDARRFGI